MSVIDFETKHADPKGIKGGASKYSLGAEVLCLSYTLDGETVKTWTPGDNNPYDLFEAIERGEMVFAHNATFEINIWRNVMVTKHGWPPVPDQQWACTMSEVLSLNLPAKLEHAGEALGVDEQKDKAGHRLMQSMTKPRKPRKAERKAYDEAGEEIPILWRDTPEDRKRLIEYCEQDVRAEVAIHNAVPRLNQRELSVFHFDQKVNRRGVAIDPELARSALVIWDQHTEKLTAELSKLTGGAVPTSTSVAKLTEWLTGQGVEVDNLRKETVAQLLTTDLPPAAKRALEIRQELGMSSIAKYTAFLACCEPDNRIRGCFQYHGAGQTGRWAGRLVQLQNLPRGGIDGDHLELLVEAIKRRDLRLLEMISPLPVGQTLSSMLRSVIVAPPGKKLIVTDFAAVEARGAAWAANETWLIKAFNNNEDPYCLMAADIYDRPVTKADKLERFVGKQAVLGCTYQLGATRFQNDLEVKWGVPLSLEFCQKVIDAYRSKNANIKRMWYRLQEAAIKAVQAGGEHRVGPYVYSVQGDFLKCRMPTGRYICYYKPEIRPGQYGPQLSFKAFEKGKLRTVSTYGGSLFENVTQAVCRDILVDSMARLEQRGYTVVGHVHDEVICEVDEDFGSAHEMEQIMCEVPAWAKGFPVGAEGFECTRYRK